MNRDPSELRISAGVRVLLAVGALAATVIDPSDLTRHHVPTYFVLAAYVAVSGLLYAASVDVLPLPARLFRTSYWIDVVFYGVLVALGSGGNSIFFVLCFFSILVASFDRGFRSGFAVTCACAGIYVVVGLAMRSPEPDFSLDRFLLRSSSLLVLGYLMAYWGDRELRLRRRLTVLQELSRLATPRHGVERILAQTMVQLRSSFDADSCLVITKSDDTADPLLRRVSKTGAHPSHPQVERAPGFVATALLALGDDACIAYRVPGPRAWLTPFADTMRHHAGWAHPPANEEACSTIAQTLETPSFVSAPLRLGVRTGGRLVLTRDKPGFRHDDAEFLQLAVDQLLPMLQYVALIDDMVERASEEERRRIALDIHDQIIQPYIGLQFGLTSIAQLLEAPAGGDALAVVRARAQRLLELAESGIADLRRYVNHLRHESQSEGGLTPALKRYVARFSEVTGLAVDIDIPDELAVDERIAATVFPIVSEALSNVRRHTSAKRVTVTLGRERDALRLCVENDLDPGAAPDRFFPASITERVAMAGGSLQVDPGSDGRTRLNIVLPL